MNNEMTNADSNTDFKAALRRRVSSIPLIIAIKTGVKLMGSIMIKRAIKEVYKNSNSIA